MCENMMKGNLRSRKYWKRETGSKEKGYEGDERDN